MTIRLECPSCQRTLRVPDHYAGRSAKCPGCGAKLTIPSAGTTDGNPFGFAPAGEAMIGAVGGRAVDVPAEDDQRVSADLDRLRKTSGWQSVAGGLNNIWIGTGLQALGLSTVLLMVLIIVGTSSRYLTTVAKGVDESTGGSDARNAVSPMIMTISVAGLGCVALFLLVGTVFRLIGCVRCLATPPASGARTLAWLMAVCEPALVVGYLLALVGQFVHVSLLVLGWLVVGAAAIAGLAFLLFYLRTIGTALAARPINHRVRHMTFWLIGGLGAMVVLLGCSGGMLYAAGNSPRGSEMGPILALPGCGIFFLTLVGIPLTLFIKYLGTISLAAEEVRKRTSRFWY